MNSLVPVAYEAITVGSNPVGLSAALYAPTSGAYAGKYAHTLLLSAAAPIRFHVVANGSFENGAGMVLPAGFYTLRFSPAMLANFRAVASPSTTLHVTYLFTQPASDVVIPRAL